MEYSLASAINMVEMWGQICSTSITTEFQKFFTTEGGDRGSFVLGMVGVAFHGTDLQLAYSMPAEEPCFEGLVGFRIVTKGQV